MLIAAVFHFEYHQRLEELKDDYAPFDPDAVTKAVKTLLPQERQEKLGELFEQFGSLMERANFKRLGNLAASERQPPRQRIRPCRWRSIFACSRHLAVFTRGERSAHVTRRIGCNFWHARRRVKLPSTSVWW